MKKEKQKAIELRDKFKGFEIPNESIAIKQCAIICLENEYKSLREQLFNLKVCKVIESDFVYNFRLNELIHEEQTVKKELESL